MVVLSNAGLGFVHCYWKSVKANSEVEESPQNPETEVGDLSGLIERERERGGPKHSIIFVLQAETVCCIRLYLIFLCHNR